MKLGRIKQVDLREIWMELPNKKASRIKQSRKGDFTKEDNWIEYFEWLSKTAILFQETFNKYQNEKWISED